MASEVRQKPAVDRYMVVKPKWSMTQPKGCAATAMPTSTKPRIAVVPAPRYSSG
jgi:hypothetical protein